MAIGGGGGGRGRGKDGEVKNRPDPTGKQDLFGSRAYFESNAAVLGKNGGASRKSGDAPLLDFKQNGGMLMVKDRSKHGIESERSRKIGNQELLLGASMNRGRIEKNHSHQNPSGTEVDCGEEFNSDKAQPSKRLKSEESTSCNFKPTRFTSHQNPYGPQVDCGEEFNSDKAQPSKRLKSEESTSCSFPTREYGYPDHFILGNGRFTRIIPLNEDTTGSSHSNSQSAKEFYSMNTEEDDPKAYKCKATPPLDWQKGRKRFSIDITSSKTIKNLSFTDPANLAQKARDKSSTIKVPCAGPRNPTYLDVKLIPLPNMQSDSVLANNNNMKKKKRRKWEDIKGDAGLCETGKHSSGAEWCTSHSNHSIFICDCERKKYDKKLTDISKGEVAKNILIQGDAGLCETGKHSSGAEWCTSHSNHSIFICDCERKKYDKKLTDIAKGEVAKNIQIPGCSAETEILTTCKLIDGIVKSVTTSHRNDMCYNGRFSLDNFFCNGDGDVKMDGVEPVKLTSQGSKSDKKRAAGMIRAEFFLTRVVPPAVESLLKLLEAEDTKNTELIENHSSVQPPLKKLALCEFMYRNLICIKGRHPKLYRDIVDEVESRVRCRGWQEPAKLNSHLKKVLEYKNPGTHEPTKYDDTAEGLLHYTYNSIKHLIDHAYEDGVLQYDDREIDQIISGTFPGLIEAFQEAMFHHGRLFKLD